MIEIFWLNMKLYFCYLKDFSIWLSCPTSGAVFDLTGGLTYIFLCSPGGFVKLIIIKIKVRSVCLITFIISTKSTSLIGCILFTRNATPHANKHCKQKVGGLHCLYNHLKNTTFLWNLRSDNLIVSLLWKPQLGITLYMFIYLCFAKCPRTCPYTYKIICIN